VDVDFGDRVGLSPNDGNGLILERVVFNEDKECLQSCAVWTVWSIFIGISFTDLIVVLVSD